MDFFNTYYVQEDAVYLKRIKILRCTKYIKYILKETYLEFF